MLETFKTQSICPSEQQIISVFKPLKEEQPRQLDYGPSTANPVITLIYALGLDFKDECRQKISLRAGPEQDDDRACPQIPKCENRKGPKVWLKQLKLVWMLIEESLGGHQTAEITQPTNMFEDFPYLKTVARLAFSHYLSVLANRSNVGI